MPLHMSRVPTNSSDCSIDSHYSTFLLSLHRSSSHRSPPTPHRDYGKGPRLNEDSKRSKTAWESRVAHALVLPPGTLHLPSLHATTKQAVEIKHPCRPCFFSSSSLFFSSADDGTPPTIPPTSSDLPICKGCHGWLPAGLPARLLATLERCDVVPYSVSPSLLQDPRPQKLCRESRILLPACLLAGCKVV